MIFPQPPKILKKSICQKKLIDSGLENVPKAEQPAAQQLAAAAEPDQTRCGVLQRRVPAAMETLRLHAPSFWAESRLVLALTYPIKFSSKSLKCLLLKAFIKSLSLDICAWKIVQGLLSEDMIRRM